MDKESSHCEGEVRDKVQFFLFPELENILKIPNNISHAIEINHRRWTRSPTQGNR